MSVTRYILVLSNAERTGGRFVAGKLTTLHGNGALKVLPPWVRLMHPDGANGGAVPVADTFCGPDQRPIRPLDVVKVTLLGQCKNADSPEDWTYDPTVPWERIGAGSKQDLDASVDAPARLWHLNEPNAVPAGYVRSMPAPAASVYLIKAPTVWTLTCFREWSKYAGYDKRRRRLLLEFGGDRHELSITDPIFDRRFRMPAGVAHWPLEPQTMKVPNPGGCYFCVSLTPELNNRHYKICATMFET